MESVLTKADLETPTWKRIHDYLAMRLTALRAKNDGPMSEEKRNQLVGQIREVKRMQELAALRPLPPETSD